MSRESARKGLEAALRYVRLHRKCPLCGAICQSWSDRVEHLRRYHEWK